jgi:hypothetical protein
MAQRRASQVPIHTSTHPPKPSAKKQSPSPSQHAPRRSKKPKAHSSAVSTTKLIEISDKEEEEDEKEEEDARPFKFKTT